MDERVLRFRVGVVVVATAIIAAILIVLFGKAPTAFRRHYTLYIELLQAPGIVPHSPVRRSGATIGRVAKVSFTEDGHVLVEADVYAEYQLGKNERCRVTGTLLGGDAALDFTPTGKPEMAGQHYKNGDRLRGEVAPDPLEILNRLGKNLEDLPGTVQSVGRAGDQVAKVAARLDSLLAANDQQIHGLLQQSEKALNGIAQMADAMHNILGDPQVQKDLREGISQLPRMLAETRETMAGIRKTVALAQKNLTNLQGLTEPLRERGDQIVGNIDQSVQELDEVLQQVLLFVKQVNSSEGTLGQLLHNPELYHNLNRTVTNVERLSCQLRPILDDVRVFTDKIARDPGRLGVRGVFQKPSGLK